MVSSEAMLRAEKLQQEALLLGIEWAKKEKEREELVKKIRNQLQKGAPAQ